MNEFVANEWTRAGKSLISCEQLIETDPDSAASRAYYAAFHAVTTRIVQAVMTSCPELVCQTDGGTPTS